MRGVGLYETGFWKRGGGFEGVVEVDEAVGGAGEDLEANGVVSEVVGREGWGEGEGEIRIGRRESCRLRSGRGLGGGVSE